jgi:hypothetical protein
VDVGADHAALSPFSNSGRARPAPDAISPARSGTSSAQTVMAFTHKSPPASLTISARRFLGLANDLRGRLAMPRTPGRQQEAVWCFLNGHRGQMFCADCLGAQLGVTSRPDRVLFGAEGRGARRRHGPCAMCGKGRLLCGFAAN